MKLIWYPSNKLCVCVFFFYKFLNKFQLAQQIKMANDREVLRIIWEGQIPICFQADLDEANAVRQPENFYLMVSRLSYLPLVTDKVNETYSFIWRF